MLPRFFVFEDSEESMEVDVRELAVPIDKALEDQLLYASKPDIIKNLVGRADFVTSFMTLIGLLLNIQFQGATY